MPNRLQAGALASHPLALLAGAFALGIAAVSVKTLPLGWLIASAAVNTLVATLCLLRQRLKLASAGLMLATMLLGSCLAVIEKERVPANRLRHLLETGTIGPGQPVEITGVLEREPEVAFERWYLFLKVQTVRVKDLERVASGELVLLAPVTNREAQRELAQLDLRYGARLRVMTLVERADDYRNPGVTSATEYLERKGYDATAFIKSPLLIERLENERVFLPLAWLYEWRRKLQSEIDSRFASDTAGVLDAALLGNRYNLSRPTADRFRDGGTFHVLVISGLHITFLGGLVFLLARRLTKNRVLQFLLSAAVLWGYALAVGAESSVVRAALMFSLVLLAPLVARHAASLNALGGAALVLLVRQPAELLNPSFQLTFFSVLAIVIFAWPLLTRMSAIGSWRPTRETPYPPACPAWFKSFCESLWWSARRAKSEQERLNYSYLLFKCPLAAILERLRLQGLLRYIVSGLAVSVCVQLTLLPFLVVYFHRLSFASLLLNLWVSLLLAVLALVAGCALLLVQVNSAVAAPLFSVANALNWAMVHGVDPFTKVGAASIRLPEYTGWASLIYVSYYLPLIALALALARWQPLARQTAGTFAGRIIRWAAGAQSLLLAAIVFHPFSEGRPTGKLRIDFLDVGQGDAALVTFPDNTTLLIDGGGRPGPFQKDKLAEDNDTFERETRSIGEAVVSEYLWWRGLDHVDYLLATHADADHIEGLSDVARNFSVRAALVARNPERDPEYREFADTLAQANVPVRLVGAGDVIRVGSVETTVLWPLPLLHSASSSHNNDSVVLRLELGEVTMLLTGDLEAAGEEALLKAPADLRAEVIKVGHHGSRTSSTAALVAAVRPRYAIISVGQTSIFGHPNREVVERWTTSGARVLTTGNSGTITVTTDGRTLNLETFVK